MKTLGSIDGDLDWTVASDGESLAQRVRQRMHFWLGEWFLHTDRGVPYLPDILGHFEPDNLAEQIITSQIRTVPEVDDVTDVEVEYDWESRKIFYAAVIHSRYGRIEISEQPGNPS